MHRFRSPSLAFHQVLALGAAPPDSFDAGVYSQCTTSACAAASPAVTVFLHASSGGAFDATTIFRIAVNGTDRHFSNVLSTVHVGEEYAFRNPPHFMDFVESTPRDSMYEVEALLDHLYYHSNVAPFVASRLIQRLVTSNPSPRYIQAVADAFRTGAHDGTTYSGAYGKSQRSKSGRCHAPLALPLLFQASLASVAPPSQPMLLLTSRA